MDWTIKTDSDPKQNTHSNKKTSNLDQQALDWTDKKYIYIEPSSPVQTLRLYSRGTAAKLSLIICSMATWKTTCTLAVSVAVVKWWKTGVPRPPLHATNMAAMWWAAASTSRSAPVEGTGNKQREWGHKQGMFWEERQVFHFMENRVFFRTSKLKHYSLNKSRLKVWACLGDAVWTAENTHDHNVTWGWARDTQGEILRRRTGYAIIKTGKIWLLLISSLMDTSRTLVEFRVVNKMMPSICFSPGREHSEHLYCISLHIINITWKCSNVTNQGHDTPVFGPQCNAVCPEPQKTFVDESK